MQAVIVVLFVVFATVSSVQQIRNDLNQNQPISNALNQNQPISNALNQNQPINDDLKKRLAKVLAKRGDEFLLGNLSSKKNRRRLRNLLPKRLFRDIMVSYRENKRQDQKRIRKDGRPYTQENQLDDNGIAFVNSPVLCSPAGTMTFHTSICYGGQCVYFEYEQTMMDCLSI